MALCFHLMDCLVHNFAEKQNENIIHVIYWLCIDSTDDFKWSLVDKSHLRAGVIKKCQLIWVKQACQRRKKRKLQLKNTAGISSTLDSSVQCYVCSLLGQEMYVLLSYWMDSCRVNIYGTYIYTLFVGCIKAEIWYSSGWAVSVKAGLMFSEGI